LEQLDELIFAPVDLDAVIRAMDHSGTIHSGWFGSGWRQSQVCRGQPLLSRPWGAVGSWAAAVESAAVSVVDRAVVRVGALVGWYGC